MKKLRILFALLLMFFLFQNLSASDHSSGTGTNKKVIGSIKKKSLPYPGNVPPFHISRVEVLCAPGLKNRNKKRVHVISDAHTRTYWNNIVLVVKTAGGAAVLGSWSGITADFYTPPLLITNGQQVRIELQDGLATGYAGNGNPFLRTAPACVEINYGPSTPVIKKSGIQ